MSNSGIISIKESGGGGGLTAVNGTNNQIVSSTPTGPSTTLSLSPTLIAPGFIEATSSVEAGTNFLLPQTTSTQGQLYIDGVSFMSSPLGGAAQLNNTFLGASAGTTNNSFTGIENDAFGTAALVSLGAGSGSQNVAVGYSSMGSLVNNSQNVAVGTNSLATCVSDGNCCVGFFSGASLSTGNINTYIGCRCGQDGNGSGNVAAGFQAAFNVAGSNNVAIGTGALINGSTSLTGSGNIAIGAAAANNSYTGSEENNICIGNPGTAGDNGTIKIGTNVHTTAFIQGISGVTVTGAAVLCSTAGQLGTISSTRKVKSNIVPMADASSKIMELNPVTFNYTVTPEITSFGLISEEVQEVMPALVLYDDKGEPASVKYHELPAMLLNEIIKLQKRIAVLEAAK